MINSRSLFRFLDVDSSLLLENANAHTHPNFARLNEALVRLIDEFSVVSFVPLDVTDQDSVAYVFSLLDHATQYGEDLEPKEVVDHDLDQNEEVDV